MPLQNITYNEIVTQLRSYITTNCKNVDNNFNSLPAVFKSGYTKTTNLTNSGSIRSSCIERITTYVSRVSSTTINNDINAYLNTIKVTDKLNTNIPASEFIDFINDIVSFCSTKLGFAISSFDSNEYLIYITKNTVYSNTQSITETELMKIIGNNEVNDILINVIDTVKQLFRVYICKYSVSFTY